MLVYYIRRLVEGVGAGAPVSEDQAEANCLQEAGSDADGNSVQWAALKDDL